MNTYLPIADYGLIGDMHSCALVSTSGSVDWCCFPRFDSASVFGRILDGKDGGFFQLAPHGVHRMVRSYLPGTAVLRTTFETDSGAATLTDFMPVHTHDGPSEPREVAAHQQIARVLECQRGSVEFSLACAPRFDYGSIVPHAVLTSPHTGFAHGGADGLAVYASAPLKAEEGGFRAAGNLRAGERVCAAVTYRPCFDHASEAIDEATILGRLRETRTYWEAWSGKCLYRGPYADAVLRSAITLKTLTYAPSGALLAAATTSLPEVIGGSRNWDYRFTWLRDATLALYALFILGYREEAAAFQTWLEWSTLGRARDVQPMYGVGGERRLTEVELSHIGGHRGSKPVRIGNGAYSQFQLDIYGELLDSAHQYRKFGGEISTEYWAFLRRVVSFVIDHWREPDEGIWETRGGRKHFVLSKVMSWVALDRGIRAARALGLPADLETWRRVRSEIREDVLAHGFDSSLGIFVQAYGGRTLDASNLLLPLLGFIRADDPRMLATIRATERSLTSEAGFVYRYRGFDDGLPEGEGSFLICTFWLADNLIALGEGGRARELFERCAGTANDLGLLSEEFDPSAREMLGNFPQAFSHLGLINTAVQLDAHTRRQPQTDEGAGRSQPDIE